MRNFTFKNFILISFLNLGRLIKSNLSPISFLARLYIKHASKIIVANSNKLKCLDIGAGISPYQKTIKKYLNVSTYITLDIAPSDKTTVVANASKLPFKDSYFNIIVSFDVIQHLSNPILMIKELHRTLLKNGHVILTYPFLYPECDSRDFYRWTLEGMESLLISEGFEIITNKRRGGVFFAYGSMLNWTVQHLIPGQRKTWRSQKNFFGCFHTIIIFFLTIPTQFISWIALIIDFLFKTNSFYMGGVIVAKKRDKTQK